MAPLRSQPDEWNGFMQKVARRQRRDSEPFEHEGAENSKLGFGVCTRPLERSCELYVLYCMPVSLSKSSHGLQSLEREGVFLHHRYIYWHMDMHKIHTYLHELDSHERVCQSVNACMVCFGRYR